ncbi:hypothetical protein D3C73_1119230 [compost metagenome]
MRLALGVREQFHGGDVGVGVRDAPGHRRPCVGLFLANLAQARHEIQHRQCEQRDPTNERQHQFQGEAASQGDDRDEVDTDAWQDLDEGEQHFPDRQRGLHHLGGDPARKLIGKK